jgi:hypothetical protein
MKKEKRKNRSKKPTQKERMQKEEGKKTTYITDT